MCIERPKIYVIFYIHPAPGDVGALCKSVVTVHIGGAIVDVAGVERDVSHGAVDGRVVDLRPHPVARLERVEHPTCTWINVNFKRIRHVFEKTPKLTPKTPKLTPKTSFFARKLAWIL